MRVSVEVKNINLKIEVEADNMKNVIKFLLKDWRSFRIERLWIKNLFREFYIKI